MMKTLKLIALFLVTVVFITGCKNKEYKVSFDSDGGSSIIAQIVKENSQAKKPADPKKEGYTFLYWSLNDEEYNFNLLVDKDITLKAIWEEIEVDDGIYDVTFDSNGGSEIDSQQIEKDNLATKPNDPEKEGYIFDGWYKDSVLFDFNTPITEDIELVASWKLLITYTVTFDNDGEKTTIQVQENKEIGSLPTLEKEGYTFVGWYNKTTKYTDKTKITENVTLTPKWELNYTITFENEGEIISTRTITKGEALGTLPSDPKKEDYTFLGWYKDDKKYTKDTKITLEEGVTSLTITAKWKQNKIYKAKITDKDETTKYITLYLNGNKITDAKGIYLIDDTLLSTLTSDSKFIVETSSIENVSKIKIKLSDNNFVEAELN